MTYFYLVCNVYVQFSYSCHLFYVIYAHHAMVAFLLVDLRDFFSDFGEWGGGGGGREKKL